MFWNMNASKSWKSLLYWGGGCFPGSIPHSHQLWPIWILPSFWRFSPRCYTLPFYWRKCFHISHSVPRANVKWNYFKLAFTYLLQVALNTTFFNLFFYYQSTNTMKNFSYQSNLCIDVPRTQIPVLKITYLSFKMQSYTCCAVTDLHHSQ